MYITLKDKKVKTITDQIFCRGDHAVTWNGYDVSGNKAASGIYFYKFTLNGKSKEIKKMLLLK